MDFENPEVTAKAGIEALHLVLISIGMPKNFTELGAKAEDIPTRDRTCRRSYVVGESSLVEKCYDYGIIEKKIKRRQIWEL